MAEKILLVDDDPLILEGYRRSLSREFLMETALGGQAGLTLAGANGPYAVVVSDMRMPGMDGLQLLTAIKTQWPDTIRVMLTGNADMETAVNAINEGSIFRFLNKPCSKEVMAKTLTAALVQYGLVTAEKQLLEQTLSGSIQVLTEVLSLVNPAAFSRAERARRYIHHVVTLMKLGNPWQYEVAAMMSQLGCVTLPPETIDAVYSGKTLTTSEQSQYDSHPLVAYDLLSKIPRLEPIAWMIKHQNQALPEAEPGDSQPVHIQQGSEILRLTLAYEKLIHQGKSRTEAAHTLSRQNKGFSPDFFQALVTLDPNAEEGEIRRCRIEDLVAGMIIQQEVRSADNVLLVSKGQEVTPPLVLKLKNFQAKRSINADVTVSMPRSTLAFVIGAS
ncbi:MAG TPA: HD domain-containing phosphohydrolase [Candidatus Dormibacteraeota bacterium]|jgi:response regulator RpfG family c-di-GMP phosphodiesterase|nr:HD domain-containing phosphohydrolase [Candidatus Dormibacteraeota bacterium]